MIPDEAAAPWSRLWQAGVLHSCATGIQGNYDGPIRAFWERQFDALGDGARVVDLGTGNGPLLLLARGRAQARGVALELHGVDTADIDPPRALADGARLFAGVRFHPRTSACALPFGDGTVDLVCSQFGFEYAPREAALAEMLRVAAPRGRIALVVHSDDSVIARVSAQQRQGCAFLRASPVVERARALVPVLHRAARARHTGAPAPQGEAERLAFNRAAQALMDMIEALPEAQVLRSAATQIRNALEAAAQVPVQADAMLARLHRHLADEDLRLRQQQDAQLSAADLEALAVRLRAHGYAVRHAPLEQRPGAKIGWALEAVRG
ncbi:class I SAM-dependent methyltransferase [Pseudoxanthomonas taiwanensis]|jgi:Methylase involved in ubiquinone/menaquinone biosynthesis|uniref:Methyltransferase type 11 domain-containing protein n=1 Tax=Pseudoxanthomonas taiwanensis TaxID=176598 RepID=A0A921NXS0_9GAMM|nr:class I SAM-dependent methyltransferase [Pseudoxanthomonas taiwanensis]KAF1690832.1 hypothetical protein CR938_00985 [Pseudoxanthomonas taiwanensis]MBO2468536.1 hypothetical protein [Xanthomonadaceae bacterium]